MAGVSFLLQSERVRVLHVITRLIVGGAAENTLLTVARLNRARYDITLASGPSDGPEGSMEDRIPGDVPFVRIPELVRDPHPVKDVLAAFRLYALMRRGRYHIVHTHTTKAGLLGRMVARLARVPIVVHTPHGHSFHDYLNAVESGALKCAERWSARWTNRVICLTEIERQDHLRFRIGPPEKFEVIHSGVDIDRFRQACITPAMTRQALGLPPEGPLVGCVARLVPVKGIHVLLEALPLIRAVVPHASVVLVGDGPLHDDLVRRTSALGLDGAVTFLGLRRNVAEIMPLFDVVAVPSLSEGMGRVAVEALAAGRPVIGTRVDGLQRVIADGETGFLVPPADPGALARAVIRCLTDPGLSAAMSAKARGEVDAYDIEQMIDKISRVYDQLVQAAQVGSPSKERTNTLP